MNGKNPAYDIGLVQYPCTNETLDAILNGMDVGEKDSIIAVGGSGDQAFALLEKAHSVTAVDRDPMQTRYIEIRADMLLNGDIDGFLCPAIRSDFGKGKSKEEIMEKYYYPVAGVVRADKRDWERMANYFLQPGRIERIKANLGNLEIKKANDFLDEIKEGKFSKAYISNIIGYCPESIGERILLLKQATAVLLEPCMLYVSNCSSTIFDLLLKAQFRNMEELTDIARKAESVSDASMLWRPAVFRRKA